MKLAHRATLSLALALSSTAPSVAARPALGSLTVSRETDFVIPVTIEGQQVRLRVDPAIGRIVLNPGVAARLGLKPNFLNSVMKPAMLVGSERINGTQAGGKVAIGSWTGVMPVLWFERDIVSDAEGVIGIADLPHDHVTMQLRPAQATDTSFTFPVASADLLGLVHRFGIGGKDIVTRFSLHQPITQASASAGAILAEAQGGAWVGEPSRRPIVLGVSRPIRPLAFTSPLSLNGMLFSQLLIRTADYRGGYRLPTDPPADPNEIVVTGSKAKGRAHLRLTVSADRLSACSSVSYARKERQLTLICPRQ